MLKKNKKYIFTPILLGIVATPLMSIIACSSKNTSSVFDQGRQTVVTYKEYNKLKNMTNSRVWDMSVQERLKTVYGRLAALTPMLFKSRVKQESVVEINAQGKTIVKTPRKSQLVFDAASAVIVNGTKYTTYKSLENGFTNSTQKIEFEIKPGTRYVNSKGEQTKYEFKAIDFFYGWLRGLYTNEKARIHGNVMGKNNFPKLSPDYLQKLKDDGEFYSENGIVKTEYNNGNVYLFNLFNVDIQKTIEQNTGINEDKNKFKLIFSGSGAKINVILGLLANYNIFTASSSQKIEELRGAGVNFQETPGKYIQLGEYGTRVSKKSDADAVDLSNLLLVSRYYLEKYNINPDSDGIILKKNKHSFDEEFNNRKDTINKYQLLSFKDEDENSFHTKRQKSFLQDNSESILFKGVQTSKSLVEEIENKGIFSWTSEDKTGLIRFLMFNPWYMLTSQTSSLSDNAVKLLFGVENKASALTSSTADDEYFLGRGRRFRALLNASLNLKAISDDLFTKADFVKTANTYYPQQPLTLIDYKTYYNYEEETDTILNTPIYSATDAQMAQHVIDNVNEDWNIKYKTIDQIQEKVKAGWIALIKDAGLTTSDIINIPLYDYRASDFVPTQIQNVTYQNIIDTLNTLTPSNLNFTKFEPEEDKEVNNFFKRQTAPLTRVGLGPDYNSSASIIQQLIGSYYGYGVGAQVLAQVLSTNNSENNVINEEFKYTSRFGFTKFKEFMNNNSQTYSKLTYANAKAMTMEDWIKFRVSSFNSANADQKAKIQFFEELDDALSKFFKETVAEDQDLLIKWSKFAASFAFENKLSVTVTELASIATPYFGQSAPKKQYQSKWMHFMPAAGITNADFTLVDSKVDLED